MLKPSTIISLIGLGVATIGTVYSIASGKRLKDVCRRLDVSIDDLVNKAGKDIQLDISDKAVNEAIDRLISEQVAASAPRIEAKIRSDLYSKISDEVKREVNAQYNDIKTNVVREVKEKVGHIDISDVKKQVIADAKEEAAGRFRDELDNILERFNDQLSDVKKIYSSIAKTFSDN